MDSDAYNLVRAVALANKSLFDFQRRLSRHPAVTSARGELDAHVYQDSHSIVRWVEADLINETNLCWWFEVEIKSPQEFSVDTRIYVSHGDNIHVFPSRDANNISDLIIQIDGGVVDLVTSTEMIPGVTEILRTAKRG